MKRASERLLDLARKCFEDAAECSDPAQMKVHAEMGRRYLEQAEAAARQEAPRTNGDHSEL
jgi:hypothetical protein